MPASRTHVSRLRRRESDFEPDKENAVRKDITVTAEVRASRGKNEARRTRRAGQIPAVVYGALPGPGRRRGQPERDPARSSAAPPATTPFSTWRSPGGETTPVMVVDQQVDPIKGTLLHADLKRIDLTKRIRVTVPVHTDGRAQGRQGAGRTARNHHPRRRNRVPAGRDSGELHGRCHAN